MEREFKPRKSDSRASNIDLQTMPPHTIELTTFGVDVGIKGDNVDMYKKTLEAVLST